MSTGDISAGMGSTFSINPDSTHDATAGFGSLFIWVNTVTGATWVCKSAAPGAAVWVQLGAKVRRLAGTRNELPDNIRKSNGTNTTVNFRKYTVAQFDIVDPSVVYVGFTSHSSAEPDFDNAVTYHTAVEMPDGSFHEFLKGGSANHVVNPGDIFNESDRITGFTIPKGTGFWLRGHVTVTAGQFYYFTPQFRDNTFDTVEEGVGLADKTLSGTIANGALQVMMPAGLMSTVPSTRRLFAIVGDSIFQGVGGYLTPGRDSGWGAGLVNLLGHEYVKLARQGGSAFINQAAYTKRAAFMVAAGCTDAFCDYGVNDIDAGNRSAANTQTALNQMHATLRTSGGVKRVYQSTITPGTTVTSNPTTDINQTTDTNQVDGRRFALNSLIRAGSLTGMTGYVEAALLVENALNANWWKAGYSNDAGTALHPTQIAGDAIVSAALPLKPF